MAMCGPPTRTSPEGVGILMMESSCFDVAGDEFVGLGDGNAFDDAGHGFENAEVDGAVIAGDADGGAAGAGDGMGFEAEGFDAVADGADLFVGGVGLHDNEHRWPRLLVRRSSLVEMGEGRQRKQELEEVQGAKESKDR